MVCSAHHREEVADKNQGRRLKCEVARSTDAEAAAHTALFLAGILALDFSQSPYQCAPASMPARRRKSLGSPAPPASPLAQAGTGRSGRGGPDLALAGALLIGKLGDIQHRRVVHPDTALLRPPSNYLSGRRSSARTARSRRPAPPALTVTSSVSVAPRRAARTRSSFM